MSWDDQYRMWSRGGQVGDVTSDARGSGARYNAGKPRLDLIPVRIIDAWLNAPTDDSAFVETLDRWQRREAPAAELLAHFNYEDLCEAARVFEYGAQKYAAWNWAKGMAWSVPVGCILRHALADEVLDEESGLPHWGHMLCNVIMLVHFEETYPEGDDRPQAVIWGEDDVS